MERQEYFKEELALIKDKNIRRFTEGMLERLPAYFFEVAASSSGRYHPKFALEEHGLVKHTKMLVKILVTLLDLEMFSSLRHLKDIAIASGILHDGYKSGEGEYGHTVHTHPLIIGRKILEYNKTELKDIITEEQANLMNEAVISHMGEWTESRYDSAILPKPKTGLQKIVHLADYIASRKFITMDE